MFENRSHEAYAHSCSTAESTNDDDYSQYSGNQTPKFVEDIVCFSKESIDSVVEVSEVPGKGRCLFSRKEFEPGTLIFAESPLFMILPNSNEVLWEKLNNIHDESPLVLPPLWHKAALLSIIQGNDETNEILRNKWVENPNQEVTPDVYRILSSICTLVDGEYLYEGMVIKPETYQLYLQVWPLNAFGRSSDPDGLVIYDKISYVAHSCNPSCCWHHTENDEFVLRARKKLVPGDEITISYLGETDLLSPTYKRRSLLENWHFFCRCDRCSIPVDKCRGFLCKCCHYGTIFLNYDSYSSVHTSTNCDMCWYKFTQSETNEYIDLELAYVQRIEAIEKNDLTDILQVYDHAKNVFRQHWALYQLQTLMYEYYKGKGNLEQAKMYLIDRLHYVDKVVSGPLYCVAFMHEELADILSCLCNVDETGTRLGNSNSDIGTLNMIMSYYFNSAALLSILCGCNHSYYYSVVNKRFQVEELAVSLIKKMSNMDSTYKNELLFGYSPVKNFKRCHRRISELRGQGGIGDDEFSMLYGLYKQAKFGDCKKEDDTGLTVEQIKRRESWRSLKGTKRKVAIHEYIDQANRIIYKYSHSTLDTNSGVFSRVMILESEDNFEYDEFFNMVADGNLHKVKEFLTKNPTMASIKSPEGLTPLHLAADRGNLELVKYLLESGANINAVDENGDAPLHIAVESQEKTVIQFLIDAGADVDLRNYEGVSSKDLMNLEYE